MKKTSKKLSGKGNPVQVPGSGEGGVYEEVAPNPPPQGIYPNPKRAAEARPIPNTGAAIRELVARPTPGVSDASNQAVLDRLVAHHNGPGMGK
jgi:hypothetical protein